MRRRHKFLLTMGAVLGLGMVAAGGYHWYLKSVNASYIAQLVGQGEPMNLAQVPPPAVPPAENSADVFLRAGALLEADASRLHTNSCRVMLMTAPGKALICSQLPQMYGHEATNPWPALAPARQTNQVALALLLKLTDHPALDFDIGYANLFEDSTLFTNLRLIELRKSEKYLRSEIVACLHEGNVTSAMQFLGAQLALAQANRCATGSNPVETFYFIQWAKMEWMMVAIPPRPARTQPNPFIGLTAETSTGSGPKLQTQPTNNLQLYAKQPA